MPAMNSTDYAIDVQARARYLDDQSDPMAERYVFGYTVQIRNVGNLAAKLISRHWVITDGDGQVEEVRGDGVVGEQPLLRPGEMFQYDSGAVIPTEVGSMQGRYFMQAEDGTQFEALIPVFTLGVPGAVN